MDEITMLASKENSIREILKKKMRECLRYEVSENNEKLREKY